MDFMGVSYREKRNDTGGFDCSGFTALIVSEPYGIFLTHSVKEKYTLGRYVFFNLRFGDLVFSQENPAIT